MTGGMERCENAENRQQTVGFYGLQIEFTELAVGVGKVLIFLVLREPFVGLL